MSEPLPDLIQSSLYLQQSNSDFRVIICAPCVEYSLSARNFTFVKSLTRTEVKHLCDTRFSGWDLECIKILQANSKFEEACPKNFVLHN